MDLQKDVSKFIKTEKQLTELNHELAAINTKIDAAGKESKKLKGRIEAAINNTAQISTPTRRKRRRQVKRKTGMKAKPETNGLGEKHRVLLSALKSSKKPLTSRRLTRKLKLTRHGLGTHVDALRKAGFKISAKRGIGYQFKK